MKITQIAPVNFGQEFKIGDTSYLAYLNQSDGYIDIFVLTPYNWERSRTKHTNIVLMLNNYFSQGQKRDMTVDGKPVFRFEEELKVGDTVKSVACGNIYTICAKQGSRDYALFCHSENIVYDNHCGKPFNSITDLLNYHLSGGYKKVQHVVEST